MLLELKIEDLALIEKARVEFGPGLNVLTGETGAGKTIIVEAINLLVGGRADSGLVRGGAEKAKVQGFFSVKGLDLPRDLRDLVDEDEISIARVIAKDGRSRCYLNGGPITVGQLSKLGAGLVDIHGQHDQQSLFRVHTHLDFLDNFAGSGVLELRSKVAELYGRWKEAVREAEELARSEREFSAKKDLLEFQVSEIERASLEIGEEERLKDERNLLRHLEKIFGATSAVLSFLENGGVDKSATDRIAAAMASLKAVGGIDARLDRLTDRISSVYYELEDCIGELRSYLQELSFPPGRLNDIEARLTEIELLKKKYGRDIAEVLAHKAKAILDLDRLGDIDELREKLEFKLSEIEKELTASAIELSEERKAFSAKFERAVVSELMDLGMKDARFSAAPRTRATDGDSASFGRKLMLDDRGIDDVEFMISPNKGEELRSLTKIASGGEISRAMLALKIVLSAADPVPTLIFDEIDVGIGGKVANAVGAKLSTLSRNHQVLVVTHLAQIAKYADHHFLVSKKIKGARSITDINRLNGEGRIAEIARMLGGEATSAVAYRHASEMLSAAEKERASALESR